MSSKSQGEYRSQIYTLLTENKSNQAHKLLYQWVKTGVLKQATFVSILEDFNL